MSSRCTVGGTGINTRGPIKSILLFSALATAPQSLPSQEAPADVEQEVREVVWQMRAAAEAGNWEDLQPFFVTTGAWAAEVENVVTTQEAGLGSRFWYRSAQVDLTALQVDAVGADSVLVGLGFRHLGEPIYWGATFVQRDGDWRLWCASYGYGRGAFRPGCGPPPDAR